MPAAGPSSSAPASFVLELAGAPRALVGDGRALALAPLDAAMLAWLALEGPTPRARIAALLWPDKDAEAARNSLRQRLFHLRKQTGADLVEGSTTLSLAEGVAHDLEAADTVLGDWRAEFGGEFAQWLDLQRARRRDRVRHSLVELAEMAAQVKDWDDALTHAKELLVLEPSSEDAHRRVMRLHYLAGDRAAALLAFDDCERVLKDEVGAKPSAETLALLATIDRAQPLAKAPMAGGTIPAGVLRPPRLVGREPEWAAMQQAWNDARSIVLSGEGGMGKSRLLADFAQAQGRVLMLGARPGDARVVYASLSRLLRRLPRAVLRGQEPGVRRELARVLPELGEPPAGDAAHDGSRFFNAVAKVLDPTALDVDGIAFDDLHFADEASVELLRYVSGATPGRWLLAARDVELSAAGRDWLAALAAEGQALSIALPPLTLTQIEELLASLDIEGIGAADAIPRAQDLLRHTGGNPMFLLETLKAALMQAQSRDPLQAQVQAGAGRAVVPARPGRLPAVPGVAALIERRIGQLSQPAVQLARCAAVAAPDFSIELASHVLGLRTLELADPWAELEAAQVLHDGAFAHDLIYESALASVPKSVARRLHAEIAAYLRDHGGEAARVAAHWLDAGDEASAVIALRAAAEAAAQAMRKLEQAGLLMRAADIAERLGHGGQAFELLHDALQAWNVADRKRIDDPLLARLERLAATPPQRLLALLARAEAAINRGQFSDAIRLGEAASELARGLGEGEREVEALRCAASASSHSGDSQRAVRLLRPALPWVLQQGDESLQQSFFNDLACCLDNADQPGEAQAYHQRALDLALRTGRLNDAATACANLATSLRNAGRLQQALDRVGQARRFEAAYDQALSLSWQLDLATLVLLRDLARYGDALRMSESALSSVLTQRPLIAPVVHGHLACLWLNLGQTARAQQALASAEQSDIAPFMRARVAQLRGRLRRALGQPATGALCDALAEAPLTGRTVQQAMITIDHALVSGPDAALAACVQTQQRCAALGYAGVALAANVRAVAMALRAQQIEQAVHLADQALGAAAGIVPDDLYRGELWLNAALAYQAAGHGDRARATAASGRDWVQQIAVAQVPQEFRDSFLHRNPVNRDLLALAARGSARLPTR